MARRDPIDYHGMLTVAPQMTEMFDLIERVARSEATVLVRGETGTGKELVARAIHDLSDRAGKPMRAVNCATFTPELLASELFGHRRGAFTGAVADHKGLFEQADGGTVFLDEIAEIPLDLQARLLRVLAERAFVPVGGSKPVSVDVRLVSATHRALRREADAGRFRHDLMYRVRVVPIFLPPLRDRTGDVDALSWHFIERFNRRGPRRIERIGREARDAMHAYAWPGNVRELRNVIEYAFVVGDGSELTVDELTPELRGEEPPEYASSGHAPTLADIERERILAALRQAGGRKGEAAELLDISRSTLWRKLREYGLNR